MSRIYGYSFNIKYEGLCNQNESVFCQAFSSNHILKWAYIFRDKETINSHDVDAFKLELNKVWAEGFEGKDRYSSFDDFVSDKINSFPGSGEKIQPYWRVVIITDKFIDNKSLEELFGVKLFVINCYRYRFEVSNALLSLVGEDRWSPSTCRHLYSDDDVNSNFDFRSYIADAKKVEKWELWQSKFDPAMILSLGIFAFFIFAAVKMGKVSLGINPWIMPSIIGGIGILYICLNLMAIRAGKRQNRFVSGIPFIAGIHLFLAGLMSPIKLLSLLFLLDFTIWNFIFSFIGSRK